AQELGELVYIELPEEGSEVQYDGQFGEIESVKAVSELNSPVAGKVVEVNQALGDSQEAISDSPYDAGWLMKVKPAEDSGLDNLLDHESYGKQLGGS
ncbi:MAG: glycine cleavage system protein H, partial [Planctomycetota bacterium]